MHFVGYLIIFLCPYATSYGMLDELVQVCMAELENDAAAFKTPKNGIQNPLSFMGADFETTMQDLKIRKIKNRRKKRKKNSGKREEIEKFLKGVGERKLTRKEVLILLNNYLLV